MLTFQDQYELFQELISDSNSDNLSLGKKLINIGTKKIKKTLDIYHTVKTATFTTVDDALTGTSNQRYRLPRGFHSLIDLYVTVGTNQYRVRRLIQNPEEWRDLNAATTTSTSDFLQYAYIEGRNIELYPIPSSAKTATMKYRGFEKDLSAANYTGGNITTLANGGTSVTASGSTFTSSMVGRVFKINDDGEYHFIQSVDSTTTLTLETAYQGDSISAGSAEYTIGEVTNLPDDTHNIPVTYALWQYYSKVRKNKPLGELYRVEYQSELAEATENYANASDSSVIEQDYAGVGLANPNYSPGAVT